MQTPANVLDIEAKNPPTPIHESITSVNQSSPADNLNLVDAKVASEEPTPEWEWEKGDITQPDFTIEADTLGAYDEHGNFYPNAIPEGGIVKIGGIPMKVKYGAQIDPYFNEQGFLSFTDDDSLRVGKIFSWGAFIPNTEYGKPFKATNYPGLHQGSKEGEIYTDMRGEDPSVYVVLLSVVGYPNDILPDKIVEGKKVFEAAKGFAVDTSDITQTNLGYLGFYLGKISKVGDEFDLEMLGYLKGNEISVDLKALPENVQATYMKNLEIP